MKNMAKLLVAFNENGFCKIPEVLSKETLLDLIAASDKLVSEGANASGFKDECGEYVQERNCMGRDKRYYPLLRHPETFPLVVNLLSHNIQLHTSQLIYKNPTKDKSKKILGPGWHRDIYPSSEDLGLVNNQRFEIKVAYCLSDFATKNAGVTLLAKGSHLLTTPLKVNKETIRPLDFVELEMKAGDAYVFENRTFHAGAPNFSNQTGKVIIIGYSYCWLKPDDYLVFEGEVLEQMNEVDKVLVGALKSPENKWVPSGYREPFIEWAKAEKLYKMKPANIEFV